eukprot:11377212-Alexandrium_andersonii.AAC.1
MARVACTAASGLAPRAACAERRARATGHPAATASCCRRRTTSAGCSVCRSRPRSVRGGVR